MESSTQEAMKLLEIVGLSEESNRITSKLPLLQRKRVEIARALGTRSELLLLDEPMAGLNHVEISDMINLLKDIHSMMGITICIIEHIMTAIMGMSNRIIVLHHGEKIAEGTPEELVQDKKVIQVYLGECF